MSIEKTYHPETIETKWYQEWESHGYFKPSGEGKPYCILLPPPNVTGSLHMGHGFGFTLMDILIRHARMSQHNTLWQPGTDHAGIATQMIIERQLMAHGLSRYDLGRDAFLKKVWEWKAESGGNITQQLRRLGASLDWTRERFTMDEDLSIVVREAFIRLFDDDLIYRGKRLVNWDPVLQTAVSDLEVINAAEDGYLWHIRYPVIDSHHVYLTVATTRPETLLGDVAVAVHPDDARYQHLIGRFLALPLTDRRIPIIADDYVDPLFGTGCVKITPAHDFNDYKVGMRHGFEPINIFTESAHLNDNVPFAYRHLERFVARKQILHDLEEQGLLEKAEKYTVNVPRGEKTNAVIEPYLTHQWFMRTKSLAEQAVLAVAEDHIRFIPDNWTKTYFQWMEQIEDWCISRQLWWGHRIPVWYDEAHNTYAGQDENHVRSRYELPDSVMLTQDHDVLDTWFSASLWPFATLTSWPKESNHRTPFFPTQALVTGFDIIFFWVARMIMMSLKLTGRVPFKEVYITGLIRDAEGHKMSKTKGNVLDPLDLIDGIDLDSLIKKRTKDLMQADKKNKIEKMTRKEFKDGIPAFGTDALRFTFCSMASFTRDIRFDINRLAGYRHFCNKLWNAARYTLMSVGDQTKIVETMPFVPHSLPDQWIRSRLHRTIKDANHYLALYRFDLFAQTLYEFTWNEFCDWYLELSKPILQNQDETAANLNKTRYTLLSTLETLLRLLHPIMPFITEDIWQRIAPLLDKKTTASIMLAAYPKCDLDCIQPDVEAECEWIQALITCIRTIRSENNIPPKRLLKLLLRSGTEKDREREAKYRAFLIHLAKLESIEWIATDTVIHDAASLFMGELELFISLAHLIDQPAEKARLEDELKSTEKDIHFIETKLKNAQFVEKAPAAIIEKEKERLHTLVLKRDKIRVQLTVGSKTHGES